MTHRTNISGKVFAVTCADELEPQAQWLVDLLRKTEQKEGSGFLRDGLRIQVGWSVLMLRKQGGDEIYEVCEPDFGSDPLHQIRSDLTCSLSVQAQQNDILQHLGIVGVAAVFGDKVVIGKGCLSHRRIYLQRIDSERGDSGWYIGPVTGATEVSEYEAVPVYQLLKLRPGLLRVLALPPGYLVVYDDEKIEAIVDPNNQEVFKE